MRAALALQREMDFRVEQPLFGTLLAEAEAAAGEWEAALATMEEQLVRSSRPANAGSRPRCIGHAARFCSIAIREAQHRRRKPSTPATASRGSRRRRALSLRAALSLAKLYQSANRPLEAHAILASALEGLSPTPSFPRLRKLEHFSLRSPANRATWRLPVRHSRKIGTKSDVSSTRSTCALMRGVPIVGRVRLHLQAAPTARPPEAARLPSPS